MTEPAEHPCPSRRRWMSILARAEAEHLQALLQDCTVPAGHTRIRGPESGLVMVRGRAGGGGAPFNLGEMTVTRCTVRTKGGQVGHAYIAGRDQRQAELAALVDAHMQNPDLTELLEARVIRSLEQGQLAAQTARAAKAAATRVQFFAMQTSRS